MNGIPSYKNSTKGEKIVGWILLVILIAMAVAYFTASGPTCTQDPFYDSSCQE